MNPLHSFSAISDGRSRTYLDSGLSPIRDRSINNNNNSTLNASYVSNQQQANTTTTANNTITTNGTALGLINQHSTTYASPLYGPLSANSHPPHPSSSAAGILSGAAGGAGGRIGSDWAGVAAISSGGGGGGGASSSSATSIRSIINTLRETSILLGETPAALTAIENRRARELGKIEENLPLGSYIRATPAGNAGESNNNVSTSIFNASSAGAFNDTSATTTPASTRPNTTMTNATTSSTRICEQQQHHFAAYDNEAPSLMMTDPMTAALSAASAVSGAGVGSGGAAIGAGGLADFLDDDEDVYGNIARDVDRELPMSFLSANGLPEELLNPDPTRVAPQLIKDIVTHTAARQRLHLRLFYDNLQDFLHFDDTTNSEWEMLLATLFVLARRRGGLSVLQRRYHEEVSELSFDILFLLLGSPEVNPKYPQVLTALNALMRRLGCKKEEDMLEQFFRASAEGDDDDENTKNGNRNDHENDSDKTDHINNEADEAESKFPRMRSAIKDVSDVFPEWTTDDDVDKNEKEKEVTKDTNEGSDAGGDGEVPATNEVVAKENEMKSSKPNNNKKPSSNRVTSAATPMSRKEAQLIELLTDAAAQLPAHPFYYSLDSLTDPADRGDLTEDEFLLLEEWFRSLPASVAVLGGATASAPPSPATPMDVAAIHNNNGGAASAADHHQDDISDPSSLSLIDTLRLVGAAMTRVKQSPSFTHSRGDSLFIGRGYLGSRYISDKTLRNFQATFAGVITSTGKRLPGGTCTFYQLMNFLYPTCPEKTLLRRCQRVVLSDHVFTLEKALHPKGAIQQFLREKHIEALMSGPLQLTRTEAEERLRNVSLGIAFTPPPPQPQPQAPPVAAPAPAAPAATSSTPKNGSRPPSAAAANARRTSTSSASGGAAASQQRRLSTTNTAAARRRSSTPNPNSSAAALTPTPAPTASAPTITATAASSPPPPLPQLVLSPQDTEVLRGLLTQERARFMAGYSVPVDEGEENAPTAANLNPNAVADDHQNNVSAEVAAQKTATTTTAPPTASQTSPRKAKRPMTPHGSVTHTVAQIQLSYPPLTNANTTGNAYTENPSAAVPGSPVANSPVNANPSLPPAASSPPRPATGGGSGGGGGASSGAPLLLHVAPSAGLGIVATISANTNNSSSTPKRSSSAQIGAENTNNHKGRVGEASSSSPDTANPNALLPTALQYAHKVISGRSAWAVDQRLRLLQRTDWGGGELNKELQLFVAEVFEFEDDKNKNNASAASKSKSIMSRADAILSKAAALRESYLNGPLKLQSPSDRTAAEDLYPSLNRALLSPVRLTVGLCVALLEWFHSLDWTHSGAITVQQFIDLSQTQQQLRKIWALRQKLKAEKARRRARREEEKAMVALLRGGEKKEKEDEPHTSDDDDEEMDDLDLTSYQNPIAKEEEEESKRRKNNTSSASASSNPYVIYCGDWRIDLDELIEYKQGSVAYKHHQDKLTRKAPTHNGNKHVRETDEDEGGMVVSGGGNHNTSISSIANNNNAHISSSNSRREAHRRHLPPTLLITFEDILRYLFLELEKPPSGGGGGGSLKATNHSNGATDDNDGGEKDGSGGITSDKTVGVIVDGEPSQALPFADVLHQPFVRSRLGDFTATVKKAAELYVSRFNSIVDNTWGRNEGYKIELYQFVNAMNDTSRQLERVQTDVQTVVDQFVNQNRKKESNQQQAGEKEGQTAAAVSALPLTNNSIPLSLPAMLLSIVNTNPAGDIETAIPYLINAPRPEAGDADEKNEKEKTTEEKENKDTAEGGGGESQSAPTAPPSAPPPPPAVRYVRAPVLLQYAASERTKLTTARTLALRHKLVSQYKRGRRRELIAQAMRQQFDFVQKSLQLHVPAANATFLPKPPVYFDLFGLSVNDTILDLSYFAARPERRLQMRELLVTLDQSGIPPRFFVKDKRLYPFVPVPSGLSGASGTASACGIYGSSISGRGEFAFTGPIHVYRDFAFCTQRPSQKRHWPTGEMQCVHVLTNIPVKSGIKFRFHFEGYNFGANCPINTIVVGSADKRFESVGTLEYYGWPDRWDQDTIMNKGNGFEKVTPYVSDKGKGFVCFELSAKSLMHVGFGVSAWMVNYGYGGKHQLAVEFKHQLARL